MPLIRFLASKCRTCVIAVILLFSEIMSTYSCCTEKKLVYIIIAAPSNCQSSFYIKCTKSNMRLSCNVKLVSDAEYI